MITEKIKKELELVVANNGLWYEQLKKDIFDLMQNEYDREDIRRCLEENKHPDADSDVETLFQYLRIKYDCNLGHWGNIANVKMQICVISGANGLTKAELSV